MKAPAFEPSSSLELDTRRRVLIHGPADPNANRDAAARYLGPPGTTEEDEPDDPFATQQSDPAGRRGRRRSEHLHRVRAAVQGWRVRRREPNSTRACP